MKDRQVESRLSRLVSEATSPYMTRDPCTAYAQDRGQLFTEQTLRQTEMSRKWVKGKIHPENGIHVWCFIKQHSSVLV